MFFAWFLFLLTLRDEFNGDDEGPTMWIWNEFSIQSFGINKKRHSSVLSDWTVVDVFEWSVILWREVDVQFLFDSSTYVQHNGVAMGAPLALAIVNILRGFVCLCDRFQCITLFVMESDCCWAMSQVTKDLSISILLNECSIIVNAWDAQHNRLFSNQISKQSIFSTTCRIRWKCYFLFLIRIRPISFLRLFLCWRQCSIQNQRQSNRESSMITTSHDWYDVLQ